MRGEMDRPNLHDRLTSRGGRLLLSVLLLSTLPPVVRGDVMTERISAALSDPALRGASVGIHVRALDTGRLMYARNAASPFIVASNQKLVTAATAVSRLGGAYAFRTRLLVCGAIKGKQLKGNLILQGLGDPSLGGRYEDKSAEEVFRRWAADLRSRGVREVEGDIVADTSFFDDQRSHPDWPASTCWKWHQAPVSALSVNDGCVRVTCKPGPAVGAPAEVRITPDAPLVDLINVCKTSARKHLIWFDRKPGSWRITVGGNVRAGTAGYSDYATVPRPALLAAWVLRNALEAEGTTVRGTVRLMNESDERDKANWRELARHSSDLLPTLKRTLKHSINLYAEHVIKTVGAECRGEGSWSSGLSEAADLLRELGFSEADFTLADGSGLSAGNRLSPAVITALLVHMEKAYPWARFPELLPVAGDDGTLASRLTKPPYKGNVRAKTGYIAGVGALSGYAQTRGGTRVAFAILINDFRNSRGNYAMKQIEDRICRAIVDGAR